MAFFTRLIFALLGMAFAVLLTAGLLCGLVLYSTFACLRWLVTGQKPQVVFMWQQIQAIRKGVQTGQGVRGFNGSQASDEAWHQEEGRAPRSDLKADVVEDVVVREIHDKRGLPKD